MGQSRTKQAIQSKNILLEGGIEKHVKPYVNSCLHCAQSGRNNNPISAPPFRYIVPDHAAQHLYMDLSFLMKDHQEIGLLVVVDHLTKYCWVVSIKNKKAETVVKFLETSSRIH